METHCLGSGMDGLTVLVSHNATVRKMTRRRSRSSDGVHRITDAVVVSVADAVRKFRRECAFRYFRT